MNCPLVSICVPIYGVEKYIERCARSLFEQTYQNIEFIFVNDCTKDASIEVLKKVLLEYPDVIDFVKIIDHEKNLGLGGARNTAVEHVSGEFMMWVDSDDYVDVDCVRKLVEKQMETSSDIVACDVYLDYGSYKDIYSNRLSDDARDACKDICSCRVKHMVWGRLIRTALYKENGIRVKQGCDMGEDYQVVPLLYYYAQEVAVVHEPLYFYYKGNVSAYSLSFSSKKAKQWLESIDILELFFRDKAAEYQKSLQIGKAIMTAQLMAGCSRGGNKDIYCEIRRKMNEINFSAIAKVPLSYRVFFLLKNRLALKIYTQIGHFVKRKG